MKYLALLVLCSCHEPVRWAKTETEAFDRARAEDRGVMVDAYVAWAMQSEKLDHILHDRAASAALAPAFVPVRLDMSNDTDADEATKARYGIRSFPAAVFVTADGTVVGRIDRLGEERDVLDAIAAAAARR